jgi:hypothetical protein
MSSWTEENKQEMKAFDVLLVQIDSGRTRAEPGLTQTMPSTNEKTRSRKMTTGRNPRDAKTNTGERATKN